jgi:glycosyltransferase involved in cell wall biosynthesis
MAAGKPVVTTRTRGCEDAVTHGVTGLLVPPRDVAALADAVTRLLGDAELRRRFGQAARREATRRFDSGRIAVQLADIIEELARRRRLNVPPRAGPSPP